MGKASKWFRGLLGWKKLDQQMETTAAKPSKDKRSWSFVKSYREKDRCNDHINGALVRHRDQSTTTARKDIAVRSIESAERVDPDKHAIAVAAATAAVAEAAVAAAHAAAAVVRLTNSGRCGNGSAHASGSIQIREVWAAVKIQAAFRGCLARKALRALRGLVRLQALVRGHIERKRTSEWLLRMQAILRAQTRARAGRAQLSELAQASSKPSSHFHPPGPATPEKYEDDARLRSLKFDSSSMLRRNSSRSNYRAVVDQGEAQVLWHRSDGSDPTANGDSQRDRILDIDAAKANRKTLFHSSKQAQSFDQHSHSFTASKESNHQTPQHSSSCEIQSLTPLKFGKEGSFCTPENSLQLRSASSKGGNAKRSPFTPTRSDGSSYLSGYTDYPNYMSFTESSKAKIRSLSAPRQRPQFERSLSTKRSPAQCNGDHSTQKVNLRANFTSKAYPGSGRLDRLGMPVMPVGHRY